MRSHKQYSPHSPSARGEIDTLHVLCMPEISHLSRKKPEKLSNKPWMRLGTVSSGLSTAQETNVRQPSLTQSEKEACEEPLRRGEASGADSFDHDRRTELLNFGVFHVPVAASAADAAAYRRRRREEATLADWV